MALMSLTNRGGRVGRGGIRPDEEAAKGAKESSRTGRKRDEESTASGEREEGALESAEELASREDVRVARAPCLRL